MEHRSDREVSLQIFNHCSLTWLLPLMYIKKEVLPLHVPEKFVLQHSDVQEHIQILRCSLNKSMYSPIAVNFDS